MTHMSCKQMFSEDDDDVQMFGEDDDDVQMFGEDDDVW